MAEQGIQTLKGKLVLTATLILQTGMHIGASKDFAPIGAVDSVVVRDPVTKRPVIPGSSLKGKLRTLLAKVKSDRPLLPRPDDDPAVVKRLFGSSNPVKSARLQFFDLFMQEDSVKRIERMSTDLYLSEIKFENTINRLTAVANPRQIERVPAGAAFTFRLVYNIEDAAEAHEDMDALATAIELLQMDYLGGHGSRGYGRVALSGFAASLHEYAGSTALDTEQISARLEGAGRYAIPSV